MLNAHVGMPHVLCSYYILYSSTLGTMYYLLILRATVHVLRTLNLYPPGTDKYREYRGGESSNTEISYRRNDRIQYSTAVPYRSKKNLSPSPYEMLLRYSNGHVYVHVSMACTLLLKNEKAHVSGDLVLSVRQIIYYSSTWGTHIWSGRFFLSRKRER